MAIAETSEPAQHRCLVYEGDPSEQLPVIVPLMAGALRDGRRCLYLGEPAMLESLKEALAGSGVDAEREIGRGALVLSDDRSYLGGGFDPAGMVHMLRGQVRQAVRDGYAGLWASGDMRWELRDDANFERLMEYESLLERAFLDLPLAGVCQYRRGSVAGRALLDAARAHRSLYVGGHLFPDNVFYVPPDLAAPAAGPEADAQGEWLFAQLVRTARAESERDRTRAQLEDLNARLEQRIAERTAELEASNRELETFSYSVAHDLRAPLRAIDGFTDVILKTEKGLSPDSKGLFERVRTAAARMHKLIDGLLGLARVARRELSRSEIDLSAVAATMLREMQSSEPLRAVEVRVQPGLEAVGDPALLTAALSNLLSNAWKFSSKTRGARIEFGAADMDGERTFFVRDNGAGFDPAYAPKLYQPFSRLHTDADFPGTGIGLATTQRIIQRHGGRLWAESKPGAGAAFFFTLPQRRLS